MFAPKLIGLVRVGVASGVCVAVLRWVMIPRLTRKGVGGRLKGRVFPTGPRIFRTPLYFPVFPMLTEAPTLPGTAVAVLVTGIVVTVSIMPVVVMSVVVMAVIVMAVVVMSVVVMAVVVMAVVVMAVVVMSVVVMSVVVMPPAHLILSLFLLRVCICELA